MTPSVSMHDESASNTMLYAIGTTTCYYIFNAPSTQYFPRLQINFLPNNTLFGEGALWPNAIRAPRSAIRLRQIRRACRAILPAANTLCIFYSPHSRDALSQLHGTRTHVPTPSSTRPNPSGSNHACISIRLSTARRPTAICES